ncbi:Arf guanine-nucleotide exchange factor gnom-like, partial [Globisporangium splendens]
MAARCVLLGDLQRVLSVARRRYGLLLNKTDSQQVEDGELAIFQNFQLIRARVQRCENLAELNPAIVLRPFLDLIRHEHTSSTLTGAALEAVRNFLMAWPWPQVRDADAVADVVSDIVDAVSQCRFQETNAESDQKVIVMVVDVLHAVVLSQAAPYLSDHSMWQLVESLYALSRAHRNDPHITLALRSAATNSLHDAIKFIFTSSSVYADSSTKSPGFGLPCAVKIVGFFCQKLHQRSAGTSVASSRREVLLAFDLLHTALLSCDARQITQVPSLMLFIKDDLCSGLLRFCRLGASSDTKIPVLCLEIIRLLWSKLRSVLKMQMEAIFNGMFGHTLHWTIANLDVTSPNFPSVASSKQNSATRTGGVASDGKSRQSVEAANEEFTGEMISTSRLFATSFEIFDCLVDLLSEATLLPDLYVNYDCDGNRSDLTQNIFELLSQVVQHSHNACRKTREEGHFLWAQGIGELALRGLFNALYVVYLRTQHKQPKPHSSSQQPSGVSISSEDDSNDDALLEENPTSPRDSVGYATAEALHKKRQRKKFFQHGIQEFNRKPIAGIKYLQQNTFLPTPLDSKSLAAFMRSLPPGLNKNAVGMYLGAMGKDVKEFEKAEIHEADTMDFHRDVLADFVKSFNFEGENIVAALRMFLASFRLPGEAQQIDRILNTFSLQVYEQCRDRFLMVSADVAYLLSFSLIMLNTDLHNPNIRPEKKMKLEDFIKNNKNYGKEVSNGRDLPDDFLTELYYTIANGEIKTFEDGGKHGEVTNDRWKDLLNQAENDPRSSRLIMHHPPHQASLRTPLTEITVDSSRVNSQHPPHRLNRRSKRTTSKSSDEARLRAHSGSVYEEEYDIADEDEHVSESKHLPYINYSASDQYDRHIFELVQQQLVRAFCSVFHQFASASNGKNGETRPGGSSFPDGMSSENAYYVPEKSMLQLACNGLVLCAAAASHLALHEHFNAIFARLCKFTALLSSDVYPLAYNGREEGVWLFCSNQSAPVATAGTLKLANTCSLSLSSDSWGYFFHAISALREFQALPSRLLNSSNTRMNQDELVEFIELVYENKEELQRREALNNEDLSSSSGGGGFLSGVAWLMSAFDTTLSSSMNVSALESSEYLLENDAPSNPSDLAEHAQDLVVGVDSKRDDTTFQDDEAEFGTEEWIRLTLAPYRLEFLLQDLSSLPTRALVEVVKALHEEVVRTLTGMPKTSPQQASESKSSRKLKSGHKHADTADKKTVTSHFLSSAGCVLFEHLLTQIISLSDSVCDGDDEEGVLKILDAHYVQLLELARPILSSTSSSRRISYENTCFLLQKAIDGVFALAMKTPNERNSAVVLNFLGTLVDISGDEELIRPFLCQMLSGLENFLATATLSTLQYSREQWLIVTNLISWSVEVSGASNHGFGLLEYLVTSQVWNVEGNEVSVSDCYTKMLMFALAAPTKKVKWSPKRTMELMHSMFTSLILEAPIDVEDFSLRFLGGMVLVCRQHIKSRDVNADPSASNTSNEIITHGLAFVEQMLGSNRHKKNLFSASSWLEILQHGLVPLGFDILNGSASGSIDRTMEASAPGITPRVLYYQQQLPLHKHQDQEVHKQNKSSSVRRRRPSLVKDPLALRPHVLMVQLISGIVCEELSQLSQCDGFQSVWDELVDLLIGLLRQTEIGSGDGDGEIAIAALERRSVLSAHEEILEHVKGIARRLSALQEGGDVRRTLVEEETKQESPSESESSPSQLYHVLVHTLVEKCQPIPGLTEQLFPAKEDSGSSEDEELTEVNAANEVAEG